MKVKKTAKPKFTVGQVVRIATRFYNHDHPAERFQKITDVWRWGDGKTCPAWGYTFGNGDMANEKWIKPLTKKQRGEA